MVAAKIGLGSMKATLHLRFQGSAELFLASTFLIPNSILLLPGQINLSISLARSRSDSHHFVLALKNFSSIKSITVSTCKRQDSLNYHEFPIWLHMQLQKEEHRFGVSFLLKLRSFIFIAKFPSDKTASVFWSSTSLNYTPVFISFGAVYVNFRTQFLLLFWIKQLKSWFSKVSILMFLDRDPKN